MFSTDYRFETSVLIDGEYHDVVGKVEVTFSSDERAREVEIYSIGDFRVTFEGDDHVTLVAPGAPLHKTLSDAIETAFIENVLDDNI